MKKRPGFVSNSSSSSFIIITDKLDKEALKKKFGLPEGHPLKSFGDSVVEFIINNTTPMSKVIADCGNCKGCSCSRLDYKDNKNVYEVKTCSEDGGIDAFLYDFIDEDEVFDFTKEQ